MQEPLRFLFFLRCGGEGEIHTLAYTLLKIQPNDRANVRVEQDSGELDAFVLHVVLHQQRNSILRMIERLLKVK